MSRAGVRWLVCAAIAFIALPSVLGCQAILGIKDPVVGAAGGDGAVFPDGLAGNRDGQMGPGDVGAAGSPPARYGAATAFDAARGEVVLFGGLGNSDYLQDTWLWDGSGWTDGTPASGNPPARDSVAMAYDAMHEQALLFGGFGAGGDETWAWDGTGWADVTPPTHPSDRYSSAIAYDAMHGQVVVFGGFASGLGYLGDTWAWDGTGWTDFTPTAVNPPARDQSAMAYDDAIGKVVLFGGLGSRGDLDDTWEWDGTGWTDVTPTTGNPSARDFFAMAYDAACQRVVLFGGEDSSGKLLDDTWAWDGTRWMNVTPATGNPPARDRSEMAYDAATQQVVLFGGDDGYDQGCFLGDTWAWDGTNWSKQ